MRCRWCWRDATTELDGSSSCAVCASPVPNPPQPRLVDRIYELIRLNEGSTHAEIIAMAIDFNYGAESASFYTIRSLVRSGAVRDEVSPRARYLYIADASKAPKLRHHRRDQYGTTYSHLGDEPKRPNGCRTCPNGLLPEWGDTCPECKEIARTRSGSKKRRLFRRANHKAEKRKQAA